MGLMMEGISQCLPRVVLPAGNEFAMEQQAARDGLVKDASILLPDDSNCLVSFIAFDRLKMELERSDIEGCPYFGRPGYVVLSRVSLWLATLAVRWIWEQDAFRYLNIRAEPKQAVSEPRISFPEGWDSVQEEIA